MPRLRSLAGHIAAAVAAVALAAGGADAAPWSTPEPRSFSAPAICASDPDRAGRPTRPSHASYRVCEDQMAIFKQGLADARSQGKLLLVSVGATWCPWCATLQKHLAGSELLRRAAPGSVDLAANLLPIEIAVSTLDKGQKVDVSSGDDVLRLLLARAPGVKLRTIPFIVIVDPADDTRVFARNLDDAANRSGDFNVARVRALLSEGHAMVRGGRSASSEPGWLWRKWLRLWN